MYRTLAQNERLSRFSKLLVPATAAGSRRIEEREGHLGRRTGLVSNYVALSLVHCLARRYDHSCSS